MGVEALGPGNGQPRAVHGPLEEPLQIQMGDEAQPGLLAKADHGPHTHAPSYRFMPQPVQPLRQSWVHSARWALAHSRRKYCFVTPQSR